MVLAIVGYFFDIKFDQKDIAASGNEKQGTSIVQKLKEENKDNIRYELED